MDRGPSAMQTLYEPFRHYDRMAQRICGCTLQTALIIASNGVTLLFRFSSRLSNRCLCDCFSARFRGARTIIVLDDAPCAVHIENSGCGPRLMTDSKWELGHLLYLCIDRPI